MKAQRLLSITMILLGRDCVSASELAERFEVSVRTIYRDIEDLCEAGIPVVAYPGSGGGYGIVRSYKLDRSLIDPAELGQAAATLASLSNALSDRKMSSTADKLRALKPKGMVAGRPVPENYVFLELAPAQREREKISLIRRAIEDRHRVFITYVDSKGVQSRRYIEPDALVFTWQAWYVFAFCRERKDFRLFKIARIHDVSIQTERFEPHGVDLDSRPWNNHWEESGIFAPCTIRFFDASRVAEYFDASQIEEESGDSVLVRTSFPVNEWLVSFLLGLGIPFEVVEPPVLRERVAARCRDILQKNTE